MKFAARYRRKAMTFISSVGVLIGLEHPQPALERELGTALCTEHPGGAGYAVGHAPAAPAACRCTCMHLICCIRAVKGGH